MAMYTEECDERAQEIAQSFSYDGYQIVRREMFAHLREPAMTIRRDSLTFNTACIEGLEDAVYVQVMVSNTEHRIVVRKVNEGDVDSLRWCIAKPDKRKSRVIKGTRFAEGIYKLMNWDSGCRYKILGHRIEYMGEMIYVFELDHCEIFKERKRRTKEEKEELSKSMTPEELEELNRKERKESMTPFSPADTENTFGLPVEQHYNQIELENFHGYQEAQFSATKQSAVPIGAAQPTTSLAPDQLMNRERMQSNEIKRIQTLGGGYSWEK